MAQIIEDIKSKGISSAYMKKPFDYSKEALESSGYKIISLQENVRLRMQEGAHSDVSTLGNWTREGVIYVPGKGKFLTRNSPIMVNAKEATACHRNEKEFYLTNEQVEQALEDSVVISVKVVPADRLAECELTAYAFGEDAKKYGEFLKEARIKEMPIWTTDIRDKAFARQVWFRGLDVGGRSALGGGRGLGYYYMVCGIRESA